MEFYCHPDLEGIIPEPVPAFKHIAEWWKKIPNECEATDAFGAKAFTAKKCMPLLDSMSMGYILPLCSDVTIKTNIDKTIIHFVENPNGTHAIEQHSIEQLGGKTSPTYPSPALKFVNHWVIKTAPGWSTLFLPPVNTFNANFTCLSGLVDTDKYPKEVNFPAVWHTPNFDGVVPAGTPLVVAIPIKRSSMERYPAIRKMTKKEFANIDKISKIQNSRRSYYTNDLREPRK